MRVRITCLIAGANEQQCRDPKDDPVLAVRTPLLFSSHALLKALSTTWARAQVSHLVDIMLAMFAMEFDAQILKKWRDVTFVLLECD